MLVKNTDGQKLTSLFTPDNIKIFNDKKNIDTLVFKLLENLALNYGIANVIRIFNKNFKKNIVPYVPLIISDEVTVYHFQLSTIKNLQLAFAFLNNGIEPNKNKTISNTKILILIISPKRRPDLFLKVEKTLKLLFNNKNFTESLLKFNSPESIWNFMDQTNDSILDNIYAGDIMTDVIEVLHESNTLKDAIDLFVNTKLLNIPVVDNERDLIGEVNTNELMKICLPRHLLWMNNIRSIINFDPFYDMLDHEDITWLADIMTHDIATVQIGDYAMKAAINMTINETSCTYVLNDKKLVGIITLEHFLNKILRQ